MSDVLGITVAELVRQLRQRQARLPFEIGAFVALETAEKLIEVPSTPGVDDVRLTDDGVVTVYASQGASAEQAARAVIDVLAHLLVAAGTGVPPVFLELVEDGPRGGEWDLPRLRDELEASLLPLNRSAARRVLSRLLRDTQKELAAASPPPTRLTAEDVDGDLDALLGDGSSDDVDLGDVLDALDEESETDDFPAATFAPAEPAPAYASPETEEDEPPTLERELPPEPKAAPQENAQPAREDAAVAAAQMSTESRNAASPAPAAARSGPAQDAGCMPDLDGFEEVGTRSRGMLWALLFLVLTAGLVVGVKVLRPDVFARMLGDAPVEDPNAAARLVAEERARAQRAAQAEADAQYGDLILSVSPERAQVLLLVGRGPAIMPNLPTGVSHEFVAIADGKEPTRAVVPADAQWITQDDQSLYELAMQTGLREMAFENVDLGESRLEADSMGQPTGTLGSVRVLTTPPGAKVYYLIGFGPDVRVRHLPVAEVQELVVYREGYEPARVVVAPSDFRRTADGVVAEATVVLERRRRR